MKIVIVGGGIGGLAAALACAKAGHQAVVFERQNEFTEIGAGIQLAPNAFHALDYLGVGDAVRELAVKVDVLQLIDGLSGNSIISIPVDKAYQDRFNNPYAVVHRSDIYHSLLQACKNDRLIQLYTSKHVTSYTQNSSRVTIDFQNEPSITADAVIGADGIRSVIRQQIVADGSPRVSGHTIFRTLIPIDKVAEPLRQSAVSIVAGPNWHFVYYPIASGKYMNIAATKDNQAMVALSGEPTTTDEVLAEFSNIQGDGLTLLKLGENWKKWVLCDRNPVEQWTDKKVTLLGDAAHPMLQYAAQGACMALEDAVVLSRLLQNSTTENIVACFEQYNTLRFPRVSRVVLTARSIGENIYHASGKEAQLRNQILASLSSQETYHKLEWLHGMRSPFFDDAEYKVA